MAPRRDDEDDSFSDDESDDEDESDLDDDDVESEGSQDDGAEGSAKNVRDAAPRLSWRERMRRRARGHGGMGRRSTGPAPRPSTPPPVEGRVSDGAVEANAEMAPDVSNWPGTADAARIVGKHVSTIKLWRAQGRIRAIQDASGCWRHHPDDLAEAVDAPDQTDPGAVLAQGMTAIVQQGSSANERLLAMTELATEGLQTAASVLSTELERAYAKIAELEAKVAELTEKLAATRELDLKHERYMRRLDQKHELELVGARETSERLTSLITLVGPIAASIASRFIGNLAAAERAERRAAGVPSAAVDARSDSSSIPPSTPLTPDERLVSFETRMTDAMSRLCAALQRLDGPAFQGLRAMMPETVQLALDDIMAGKDDSTVGRALAVIVQAAQNLSDLQFRMLQPIAPADIAAILGELRTLIRSRTVESNESPPS